MYIIFQKDAGPFFKDPASNALFNLVISFFSVF